MHADEAPLCAEVPLASHAAGAGATGKERVNRDATPGPFATRPASRGGDHPGELMPHDERRSSVGHPSEVALDLGAADARGLRLHDDLIVARPRLVDCLDRHLPRTTPDQRAHEARG